MSTSTPRRPQVGDEILVTFRATVTSADSAGVFWFNDGHRTWHNKHHKSWTVVVSEPEYEPGSVYVAPDGNLWYRLHDPTNNFSWRNVATATVMYHTFPKRPLVKMVPEATS